jgi:hypothetical protein
LLINALAKKKKEKKRKKKKEKKKKKKENVCPLSKYMLKRSVHGR